MTIHNIIALASCASPDRSRTDGRERYLLRTVAACMGQFMYENGDKPTQVELVEMVWLQYEEHAQAA